MRDVLGRRFAVLNSHVALLSFEAFASAGSRGQSQRPRQPQPIHQKGRHIGQKQRSGATRQIRIATTSSIAVTPVSRWNREPVRCHRRAGQSAPARESPPRRLRRRSERSRRKRAPHRMADQSAVDGHHQLANHHPQRLAPHRRKVDGDGGETTAGSQARAAHYREVLGRLQLPAKPMND